MLVAGEAAHVGADLGDDDQGGGDIDAVDAGEIDAAHLEQPGAQVERSARQEPCRLRAISSVLA